ncbi:MAG: YeeE/YedE family protein, partial [Burkholderiaceae bacterium]|nr:YeeE/YedE family protein [Burkholderiaceae bacterium]
SLELLMLWTDASLHVTFGIASVIGVVAGSAAHALTSGSFRWEGFASLQDLRNQLFGAVLMGFGGVTALGCTIGQGISGLSTLAMGSFIATGSIVAGSVATLKFILWKAESE